MNRNFFLFFLLLLNRFWKFPKNLRPKPICYKAFEFPCAQFSLCQCAFVLPVSVFHFVKATISGTQSTIIILMENDFCTIFKEKIRLWLRRGETKARTVKATRTRTWPILWCCWECRRPVEKKCVLRGCPYMTTL